MIVAGFAERRALEAAITVLRGAELGTVESYTPGKLSEAGADASVSPIPLVMLAAGLLGFGFMMWLQIYATVRSYPIDVGGRPNISWPAYVTNAFEIGVLGAILAGFVAFLVLNRMPRLYDRVDESDDMRSASRNGWFLSLAAGPGQAARVRGLLAPHHPLVVQELPE